MSEQPRRAVSAVRSVEPLVIEFVGTADVCRSPFCSALATSMADSQLVVFGSSGLLARRGEPIDPLMAAALGHVGVSSDRTRSRPLDARILGAADLVLTMDSRQRDFVAQCWPDAASKVHGLGQLAAHLAASGPTAGNASLLQVIEFGIPGSSDPADDVPDPRGWGEQAIRETAARLGGLMTAVLRAFGLMAVTGARRSAPRRGAGS